MLLVFADCCIFGFGGYKVRWGAWSQKSQARMSVVGGE
jgi:hypothetical protein